MDKFVIRGVKRKLSDAKEDSSDCVSDFQNMPGECSLQKNSLMTPTLSDASSSQQSGSEIEFDYLPKFLNISQWQAKFQEHDWLTYKTETKGFGCKVCISANGSLGVFKSARVRLSNEWCSNSVRAFGESDVKKRQAIRKKIFDHKNSHAHRQCVKILEEANKQILENATAKQEGVYHEHICRVFRTVYNLAKLGRPFSDLPSWIDEQRANGLDMGLILHSKHSAADISNLIGEEMRKTIVKQIVKNNLKIGVMVDESTSVSQKSVLCICLRVHFINSEETSSLFFDLVELSNTSAQCIYDSLKTCLFQHFSQEFLASNLISFACDGASNMLGSVSGLAVRLQQEFPQLIVWHCANHRLELTVGDVVSKLSQINHMRNFFDKLYSLYHASPKNRNQLQQCASDLSTKIQAIGRILGVRWVSSSARSIRAIWRNFSPLSIHFKTSMEDQTRDSKERAMYKGLLDRLTDINFVLNMGLMIDALNELEDLALQLQKREISIIQAHKLVVQKLQVFHSLQTRPGEYTELARNAAECKKLDDVDLHGHGRVCKIDGQAFYSTLVEKMKKRMLNSQSSRASSNAQSLEAKYQELLSNLEVFDEAKWPEDVGSDVCFGDSRIKYLCEKLYIGSIRETVTAFRLYASDKTVPDDLKPLLRAVKTIIISTAECERSFSVMNIICSPERNQLQVKTASNLVFLKLLGTPVHKFKPDKYVKTWLGKGRRSADENNCMKRKISDVAPPGLKPVWEILNE